MINCLNDSSESIVICISPLTTLIIDQVTKFKKYGIETEFVGEAQMDKSVIVKVLKGEVQLLYITPENIVRNELYQNMLLSTKNVWWF